MGSGIYKIMNLSTGNSYVGSAVSIDRRWRVHLHHLRSGKHHSVKLQRAFLKYGEADFEFSVLESVADIRDLIGREQHWIDLLCAVTTGYNVCAVAGSCLGVRHSEEVRAKLRGRVVSDEARARMSAAKGGVFPKAALEKAIKANTGKALSAERRAKISAANTGKSHTEETRRKLSAASSAITGRIVSPATREKLSVVMKQRVLSEEARRNISAAISASNKSRIVSDETKAKRAATWAAKRAALNAGGNS